MIKFEKCKNHDGIHITPPSKLNTLTMHGQYHNGGMEILDPFPLAMWKLKFMNMSLYYYNKMIEVETFTNIRTINIQKLLKKNVLARYGIP